MTLYRSLLLITLTLFLSGCSMPKIIVLHDPLSAEEHLRLGSIYEQQGKTDLAREQYRMAAAQDPKHARAWALVGDLSYRLGDLRDAEKAYGKALDLDPRNGDLRNNLAWVYARQERKLGRARELVERAMELNPGNAPYYLDTLGMVLLKQGELAAAIDAFERSAAAIPREQRSFRAEVYLHLAEAYAAAGNAEKSSDARRMYQELTREVTIDPEPR